MNNINFIEYYHIMSDINNADNITDIININFDSIYNYSHLISSTLGVICLKKYNPILLFVLLFAQLGYLTSTESNLKVNRKILFVCGSVLYMISEYIMNDNKLEMNYRSLWKIPYFGILCYYLFNIKDFYSNI